MGNWGWVIGGLAFSFWLFEMRSWVSFLEVTFILNHQSPITNYQLPITNHQSPITNYQKAKS